MIAFIFLFALGRAASLGLYRMCWSNGASGKFAPGSALVTLLRRPLPWLAHLAFIFPASGFSWERFPLLQAVSVMLAGLLALGAVGRFGSADLGRYFVVDRLLALALAVGVGFSPAFVYPCLVVCCCLQYTVSSWRLGPGYSNLLGFEFVRASLSLIAAVLAWCGWLQLAGVAWDDGGSLAFAALLGFQASTYVNHALAKSALGPKWYSWIRENRIECLAANAWLRGWTFGRTQPAVMKQVRRMARHRGAICAIVWMLEISWLLLLADARLAAVILGVTILFHLAVFAFTGLAPHHYVVNHLLLLGLILLHDTADIFHARHMTACLIAVAMAAMWIGWLKKRILAEYQRTGTPGFWGNFADPADHLMAWWDTPLMRMYSYSVETASGARCALPVPALSPHDTALTDIHTHLMILNQHSDLDPAILRDRAIARTGVWGLTIHRKDREFLYRLMDDPDSDLRAILNPSEKPPAWDGVIPEAATPLRAFFEGMNRMLLRRGCRIILRWPHFPGEDRAPDICPLTAPALPRFRFDERIAAVTLRRIETFLRHDRMCLIEDKLVGRIPLAENEA